MALRKTRPATAACAIKRYDSSDPEWRGVLMAVWAVSWVPMAATDVQREDEVGASAGGDVWSSMMAKTEDAALANWLNGNSVQTVIVV
jgi:hypothetical protein